MTSRYMFDGLKVDSRYLDYKKGSTYRPNEDFFKEGLNKVKVLFNTAPKSGPARSGWSGASYARSEPLEEEPRSKSAEKRSSQSTEIIHRPMMPPRHPTFIIEETRKGSKRDERVERGAKERRTRVKATMKPDYSLQRDKEFLQLIQSTTRSKSQSDLRVRNITREALDYLDTRHDYWRQQIPDHVRLASQTIVWDHEDDDLTHKTPQQAMPYVVKQLAKVTKMLAQAKYSLAIASATTLMSDVKRMERRLPGKESVLANCCSILGNAYLETGDTAKAITFHTQDLRIGTEFNIPIAKSRAYDNLGRVYARIGKFQRAINVWTKKLESNPNIPANEQTWLCHELGHCHLKLGNAEKAREYGESSYQSALDSQDTQAQLNASMLVAQAILRENMLHGCKSALEKALKSGASADDMVSSNSVSESLSNLRKAIKTFKSREKEAKQMQPTIFYPPKSSKSRGRSRQKRQTVASRNGSNGAQSVKSAQSAHSNGTGHMTETNNSDQTDP